MLTVPRIVWLCGGLAPTITGIERIAVALAADLVAHGIATPEDFRVHADPGSELRAELSALGLPCVDPRWSSGRSDADARLVHNFGRTVRWRRGADTYLFSVWDWGPFRDAKMPARARVAWTAAMTTGHVRATDVHYLNARLPELRPRVVHAPRRSFVCAAETVSALRANTIDEPAFALFVGTANARKRLDVLARIGDRAGWPVELVGQGTETIRAANVRGRGRVDEAELEECYRRAACVVLISSYEGFGVPILEAARRGIHSVVSPEVHDVLPASLRGYCHILAAETSAAFAEAVAAATAARGSSRFTEDLFDPLLDLYRERLR